MAGWVLAGCAAHGCLSGAVKLLADGDPLPGSDWAAVGLGLNVGVRGRAEASECSQGLCTCSSFCELRGRYACHAQIVWIGCTSIADVTMYAACKVGGIRALHGIQLAPVNDVVINWMGCNQPISQSWVRLCAQDVIYCAQDVIYGWPQRGPPLP